MRTNWGSAETASRWRIIWEAGGKKALGGAGRTGRNRKLSSDALCRLAAMLLAGAPSQGYATDLWTLKRIAQVTRREFGVSYHPGHVWKILGQLGWSCQRSERRARERNEAAIRRWRRYRWPRIQKKARDRGSLLILLDESGFSERPSVRRTWSPRGQTPILVAPFHWKRLSAIASLITTPAAWRVGLYLRLQPGTVKQPQVLVYLKALKRRLRGRKAVLLWDRLPAYRGGDVQAWIAQQADWLTVEYLPPYAPELNPVEYFWSHLSRTDMAQFVGEHLAAVRAQPRKAARRVRHRPNLGKAFLKHSGLF